MHRVAHHGIFDFEKIQLLQGTVGPHKALHKFIFGPAQELRWGPVLDQFAVFQERNLLAHFYRFMDIVSNEDNGFL